MTNPHRSAASAGRLPSIRRALLLLGIACTAPTISWRRAPPTKTSCCARNGYTRPRWLPPAWRASWNGAARRGNRPAHPGHRGRTPTRRAAGLPSAAGRRAAPAERGRLHAAGPAGRAASRQRHAQSRPAIAAPCPTRRWPRWDAAATSSWPACSAPPLHNEPMLAIGIPVEISGEVRYGLYAQVRPQRIGKRCAGRPCRMAG